MYFSIKNLYQMKYIKADILFVKDGYIFQQCNCVTLKPRGLSADLLLAFSRNMPVYL